MTVVDAGALVELLLRTGAGRRVRAAVKGRPSAAPSHLDAEVLSTLARLHRAGQVGADRVETALRRLRRAPVVRHPADALLLDAWSLRANVAMRDALYVALARRLGAPIVTTDARLSRAPRLGVTVTVVPSEVGR